jgi:hypothetical protein
VFDIVKVLVSAIIILVITEISKKNASLGGLIAAMPFVTLLAMFWLYYEKRDLALLSDFSKSVFWGLFPTLLFFIPLIFLFKKGWNFYLVIFIGLIFLSIGAYIHQKLIG